MNEKLVQKMRNVVADIMTHFQSDFENYDRRTIENTPAEKLSAVWIVAPNHTYMLNFSNFEEEYNKYEETRYLYHYGTLYDIYLDHSTEEEYFFIIEGEELSHVSREQARAYKNKQCEPVVNKWMSEHEKLGDSKVPVTITGISLSKLKQLMRESENIPGGSLIRAFKRFRSTRRYAKDHTINVVYYEQYNEFGFIEWKNGKAQLNGGIVFSGENYGWSRHT